MSDDDAERQARAAKRRATWSGGVARGFVEAEEADLAFWRSATVEQRLQGLLELLAASGLQTEHDAVERRHSRLVGGVRALRG
jgi:hypothetical protein